MDLYGMLDQTFRSAQKFQGYDRDTRIFGTWYIWSQGRWQTWEEVTTDCVASLYGKR